MQTSSRGYHGGDQPMGKRGHAPQISISDDNHHVTEAIGDLYGDNSQYNNSSDSRPLSFISSSTAPTTASPLSPPSERSSPSSTTTTIPRTLSQRKALGWTTGDEPLHPGIGGSARGLNRTASADSDGVGGSPSPSPSGAGSLSPRGTLRRQPSTSETANSAFPLNDIDYESNPNAIAQELNNLSALRRMSMDVNAAGDPDLPSFSSGVGIPATPPTNADPNDRARLYWVPASVHPELAPTEFKTFLDKKVKSLRRQSEERQASLSPTSSLDREGSNASLSRRRSMLSRQIDNTDGRGAEGYQDGADRLERRRSRTSGDMLNSRITNLQDLETLVNEPESVLQRLSLETGGERAPTGDTADDGEDKPILPAIPPNNNSLKRSTRTTYRRGGSLRRGERTQFSKRAAQLGGSGESSQDQQQRPSSSSSADVPQSLQHLTKIQTDASSLTGTDNFSRPNRSHRRAAIVPPLSPSTSPKAEEPSAQVPTHRSDHARHKRHSHHQQTPHHQHQHQHQHQSQLQQQAQNQQQQPQQRHFVSQIASNGRLGVPLGKQSSVPSIVETPPDGYQHPQRTSSHAIPPHLKLTPNQAPPQQQQQQPQQTQPLQQQKSSSQPLASGQQASQNWTSSNRQAAAGRSSNHSLTEISSHPAALPGNNTRTDALSFIPTLSEEKKAEGKRVKDRKEKEGDGSRKSSWSWGSLLGNEEKEKEKRRGAEESKRAGQRPSKVAEKGYENSRLDLLQTTMENPRGRESLVLDRGDIRLEEERKKESSRKSTGSDTKKEKESGFFSQLLGGGKKRGDRDTTGKKSAFRNLSPDPPMRILKPDIDYNWTRFSILEERAIYRMAHIKLANPRRALHSQVLLSNFMYSYLAKVQQMHPQANLPQSPAQRQAAAQQKADQPEEFAAYQKYQEQQREQELEEQRAGGSSGGGGGGQAAHGQTDTYLDMDYDYDPSSDSDANQPVGRAGMDGNGNGSSVATGGGGGQHLSNNTTQRRPAQHRQGQQQQPGSQQYDGTSGQMTPYAYQLGQFDDPDRADDDDMW